MENLICTMTSVCSTIKKILAFSSFLMLYSCYKEVDYSYFTFANQECKYLSVYTKGDNLTSESFMLTAAINGYTSEMLSEHGNDLTYFLIDNDPSIVDQMKKDFIFTKKVQVFPPSTRPPDSMPPQFIEYRTQVCTGLSIYASEQLFGKQPGEDLSDYFSFVGVPRTVTPLIDSKKQYLGLIQTGLSISDYLSKSPFVFGLASFKLNSIPQETLPIEVSFTIVVKLDGGITLESKSKEITLSN